MFDRQIIVVMGVTGVGKSTFIKYATQQDVRIGHSLDPCTVDVRHFQIPGTNVYLVDTPGFDDPNMSDADILKNITCYLEDAFEDKVHIQGFLYIHPINDARMKNSGMKNLRMFRSVLGMDKMGNCCLVTTKWSLEPKDEFEGHEKELESKKELWQPLLEVGARMVRFGDSFDSTMEILRPLVNERSIIPHLLKERIEDNLPVEQTQAGQIVNEDIEQAKKAYNREIMILDEEYKEAKQKQEYEFAAQLLEDKQANEAKLAMVEEEREQLRAQSERRGAGRFLRWAARGCAVALGGAATVLTGGLAAPAAVALYGGVEAAAQAHKGNL